MKNSCYTMLQKGSGILGIREKFEAVSKEYDAQRKQLIPCFDDFYRLPVEMLDFAGDAPRVLDMGSGTGLFAAFVLEKYKNAHIMMIDLSEGMLDVARKRFAKHPDFRYITADYTAYPFEEKFDIIISALSIHHLSALQKEKLYKDCFLMLRPGGMFLNADQVLSPDPQTEGMLSRLWKKEIERSGIDNKELEKAYDRQVYDDPSTLTDQLLWLKQAGFAQVDCVYKYYVFAGMYAKKADEE